MRPLLFVHVTAPPEPARAVQGWLEVDDRVVPRVLGRVLPVLRVALVAEQEEVLRHPREPGGE